MSVEIERIKKKRPLIKDIEVTYKENTQGTYYSKLKATTKLKTIFLSQENRCPKAAIRKLFSNLSKILKKKNEKRFNRFVSNVKEAA